MKPKYKRVCPYCGETCEGYVGNSLICKCGAKYYYTTQTWLERKKPKEKITPDLVEVVRCKDCVYASSLPSGLFRCEKHSVYSMFSSNILNVTSEDYCSYGERREE